MVRLRGDAGIQVKLKSGGSGYMSQSDQRMLFGMGEATVATEVEVVWPDGQTQTLGDIEVNQTIRVTQGHSGYETIDLQTILPGRSTDPRRAGTGKPWASAAASASPPLQINDPAGQSRPISELMKPGRKLLVNLWATWCVPCSKEIPELQRLSGQLRQQGVDLVGVSVDSPETVDQVAAYVAARDMTYPVFTLGVEGLDLLYPQGELTVPMTVLLDDRGQVLRVFRGWSHRTESEVLALTKQK